MGELIATGCFYAAIGVAILGMSTSLVLAFRKEVLGYEH